MNGIIDFANKFFKPILDMGAPIIMLIVLTLLALLFGVKFSKALEGGIACHRPYWYWCDHRYVEWRFLSVSCKVR